MARTLLLTGPELTADAMAHAASHGVRIIPTTPYAPADELIAMIAREQPDAIIVRQGQLTREMINASAALKIIAKHGVGYDTIDIAAAADDAAGALGACGVTLYGDKRKLEVAIARLATDFDGA